MNSTRVGFDFTSGAWQMAGIGRATRGLLAALLERRSGFEYRPFYPGLTPSPRAEAFFAERGIRCKRVPVSERILLALWHKARLPLPVEMFVGRVDLFHSPDFVLPPMFARTSVVTIHDLTYVTHPETAHPAQKRYLDATVPRAVERAARVIAVSEATRRDLLDIYGVPPEKIQVIYNGLDALFTNPPSAELLEDAARRFRLPSRFALAVGTVQPRKNLPQAARAVALVRKRGYDLHLVHVGAPGWLSDQVYAALKELDDGFIHMLGPVDDLQLAAIYSLAGAVLAVSKAEGFMLPIIEAMAIGVPVISSNVSSMPEVAGGAALLVNPDSAEETAAALLQVLRDPDVASRLATAGRNRAANFSWDRSAESTEAVYRAALESG